MAKRIENIRAELPSDLRRGGNVAVADINVEGVPSSLAAHSGIDTPTLSQQARGVVGNVGEVFETFSLPNKSGQLIPRAGDSEAKILSHIAKQLGENAAVSGKITVFTERAACASCLGVAEQFRARYPRIEVNIVDNNGVVLRPRQGK